MTARIEQETKAGLRGPCCIGANVRGRKGGDNAGLLVFGRKIKSFLPPSRGRDHMDAALEALYAVEPEIG